MEYRESACSRKSKSTNTEVQAVAQGDDQVIYTQYKPHTTDSKLKTHIQEISRNNENIMKNVEDGTRELALIINNDETM